MMMSDRNIYRSTSVVAVAAAMALSFSFSLAASGQMQGGASSNPLHIWMIVQQNSGEPVGYLKTKDLSVSQGLRRYQLTVEQPRTRQGQSSASPIPTSLLVVFDAKFAANHDAIQAAVQALHPVWERGWQVSFVRPNGLQTAYLGSEAQASRTLEDGTVQTVAMRSNPIDAVKTLEQTHGRRVLLYVSTTGGWMNTKMPVAMEKEANRVMAQVYIVDGGKPAHTLTYPGSVAYQARSSEPGSPLVPTVSDPGFASAEQQDLFKFGRFHEANLQDAVRNSMRDSQGFYDITINCAANACPNIQEPLSIQVNHDGPLKITAMGVGDAENLNLNVTTK